MDDDIECEESLNNEHEDDEFSETEAIEDNEVYTTKSLDEQKREENKSSGAGLDISVKLELNILEGEENGNKDQQVNELFFVNAKKPN